MTKYVFETEDHEVAEAIMDVLSGDEAPPTSAPTPAKRGRKPKTDTAAPAPANPMAQPQQPQPMQPMPGQPQFGAMPGMPQFGAMPGMPQGQPQFAQPQAIQVDRNSLATLLQQKVSQPSGAMPVANMMNQRFSTTNIDMIPQERWGELYQALQQLQ